VSHRLKIENATVVEHVEFGDLNAGDVFEYPRFTGPRTFMKTDRPNGLAIRLNDGLSCDFSNKSRVVPVHARLVKE
jgi:hypothetical protein